MMGLLLPVAHRRCPESGATAQQRHQAPNDHPWSAGSTGEEGPETTPPKRSRRNPRSASAPGADKRFPRLSRARRLRQVLSSTRTRTSPCRAEARARSTRLPHAASDSTASVHHRVPCTALYCGRNAKSNHSRVLVSESEMNGGGNSLLAVVFTGREELGVTNRCRNQCSRVRASFASFVSAWSGFTAGLAWIWSTYPC